MAKGKLSEDQPAGDKLEGLVDRYADSGKKGQKKKSSGDDEDAVRNDDDEDDHEEE